jgi:glucose-6-phosphate isomerase
VLLSLHNDKPPSEPAAQKFKQEKILEKLRALDLRAQRKGLESLDPTRSLLVRIGMETDGDGRVKKNSYGMFSLAWQAVDHSDWPAQIRNEVQQIRKAIRQKHGVPLRFVIWAGMGGSAEDKSAYAAVGLLRRGPKLYVLDSTDPAKLKNILEDMQARARAPLPEVLKSTLVVGQALGMTSYEPVVNIEKLSALYDRHKIDSTPNFVYMTLPDSLLDQFGRRGGYRKIELQLDNGDTTSGRHSSPLTRGSLYALALAGVDIEQWMEATWLSEEDINNAWRLAAFLHTQISAGRNKVTLLLPKEWAGISLWTKQNFEESLGKSEDFGLKVVIGERTRLANCRSPKDKSQDRCFLAIQVKKLSNGDAAKVAMIRRAGYPVAVVTLREPQLSRYMQFIHFTVFGLGFLQKMNFVTQPGVELYKEITNRLHAESQRLGGIDKTREWSNFYNSDRRLKWRNVITFCFDRLPDSVPMSGDEAPAIYASMLRSLAGNHRIEYAELTFFGDMRYGAPGRNMRKVLERVADRVFRTALKMPVDVYEGPAMNHSYHEMIIGHGRCLSTVLLAEKAERLPAADYTADYHRAQFLATQMALQQRGRLVVSLLVKDLEENTLTALDDFFRQVALHLKSRARGR